MNGCTKHLFILIGGIMKFPCKNCICLPVCIATLKDKYLYKDNAYGLILTYLVEGKRCDMLIDYIKPYNHFDYTIEHRRITRDFYIKKSGVRPTCPNRIGELIHDKTS